MPLSIGGRKMEVEITDVEIVSRPVKKIRPWHKSEEAAERQKQCLRRYYQEHRDEIIANVMANRAKKHDEYLAYQHWHYQTKRKGKKADGEQS